MISDSTIFLVSLFLIIGSIILILYFSLKNKDNTTIQQNVSRFLNCSTGECGLDLITGEKKCPSSSDTINIDALTQICVGATSCPPQIPYALNSDGSTNFAACEKGSQCNCSRFPKCPNYIVSAFTTSNGNVYQTPLNQILTLNQITTSNVSPINSYIPPITYDPTQQTLCTISRYLLPYVSPGVCSTDNIDDCFHKSVCTVGTLSYITDRTDLIPLSELQKMPVGCIPIPSTTSTPCPTGRYPVYILLEGQNGKGVFYCIGGF